MNPIDKCFFVGNLKGLTECIREAESFRKRFEAAPEESEADHCAEMWARWCENAATHWRMVSEASGYEDRG
jgi:hypothetical protein